MNPATFTSWLGVIAQLVMVGKTTYTEIASMYRAQRGATDADTEVEDDAALAQLRLVIAEERRKAQIEADLQAPLG
jgi:hypothetical protein